MKLPIVILCGLSTLVLSACEQTKKQFDFSKKAPDEFAVTTRAPLEMPPSLNTLPKPRPGAPRPQETATDLQAKQTLFGDTVLQTQAAQSDGTISAGEDALLQKTGAYNTNNNIRDKVDAETEVLVKENTSTFDKILGKTGSKVEAPATVVDPMKETERLKANQKIGAPITQGKTPTKEQ